METLFEIGLRILFLPIELVACWVTDRWPRASLAFALLLVGLFALGGTAWWTWSAA